MILKRNFSPLKVWTYIKGQMYIVMVWSVIVWLLFHYTEGSIAVLPFVPVGMLASALAIFIAFRNNSAYSRWWEARTIWGGIVNNSRIICRQLVANADHAVSAGKAAQHLVDAFKMELTYRQIAFAHALRLHLRQQDEWHELAPLLPVAEFTALMKVSNKPNQLLMQQGIRIKEGMRDEILGPFDNISMEPTLAGLNNFQGSCERIKFTPLPRQYDFFTRMFVLLFAIMLPFGILSFFNNELLYSMAWISIPISILIGGVFVIMERTGAANEDPFENKTTDVPLSALCNTIERDLKEMIGVSIPDKLIAENGYLM